MLIIEDISLIFPDYSNKIYTIEDILLKFE